MIITFLQDGAPQLCLLVYNLDLNIIICVSYTIGITDVHQLSSRTGAQYPVATKQPKKISSRPTPRLPAFQCRRPCSGSRSNRQGNHPLFSRSKPCASGCASTRSLAASSTHHQRGAFPCTKDKHQRIMKELNIDIYRSFTAKNMNITAMFTCLGRCKNETLCNQHSNVQC